MDTVQVLRVLYTEYMYEVCTWYWYQVRYDIRVCHTQYDVDGNPQYLYEYLVGLSPHLSGCSFR